MPTKLSLPSSMSDCVYFTRRSLDDGTGGFSGKAVAWVLRGDCPKCKKAKMGKPRDGDSVKIRSPLYVCPNCGFSIEKEAYESTLACNIMYTCPYCKKQGEATVPYVRKTFEGVKAVIFECQHCKKKLGITKKMKEGKKKDKTEDADIPDEDV